MKHLSNNECLYVGSPFKSVLPTSVCVPESLHYGKNSRISGLFTSFCRSEYEAEESPQYRVVSGTRVNFKENVFSQFRPSVLQFPGRCEIYVKLMLLLFILPGVDKVPLGSLKIRKDLKYKSGVN